MDFRNVKRFFWIALAAVTGERNRVQCAYSNILLLQVKTCKAVLYSRTFKVKLKLLNLLYHPDSYQTFSGGSHINSLAEKISIQHWMNLISFYLVATQCSLPSPGSTSFYTLGQARLWFMEALPNVSTLTVRTLPARESNPGCLHNRAACYGAHYISIRTVSHKITKSSKWPINRYPHDSNIKKK